MYAPGEQEKGQDRGQSLFVVIADWTLLGRDCRI